MFIIIIIIILFFLFIFFKLAPASTKPAGLLLLLLLLLLLVYHKFKRSLAIRLYPTPSLRLRSITDNNNDSSFSERTWLSLICDCGVVYVLLEIARFCFHHKFEMRQVKQTIS